MLENLRQAEDETRRRARVVVDLPGPKLRTGPLAVQPTSDRKGDYLRLGIGDRLLLTRDTDAEVSSVEELPSARIGCSLPEAFTVTRRGHRVWLDDGKPGGVVESVDQASIELLITSAGAKGSKLRAVKAINLPDAVIDIDLLGHTARTPGSSPPSTPTSSGGRSSAARARCSGSAPILTSTPGQRPG
jgi:pyruvate kinase